MDWHKWQSLRGSHFVKKDFSSSKLLCLHVQYVLLMNLQSIRICQQILQVKLISPCMHYLRCSISEHTKSCIQKLPKNGFVKKAVILMKTIYFSIILLPAHGHYVCNKSEKYQTASTSTLGQVDFTMYALYSPGKATFQEEQRQSTVKEWTSLFFSTAANICAKYERILKLFSKIRSRNQNAFSSITKGNN